MKERGLSAALLGVLGFLTAVGPFATDMYLASLPQIGADLRTSASSVQLTLTAFLLGMAFGQLLFGPLSDRFGRRRVVVIALAVFAASSVALVLSPTVSVLIALRLVQGTTGAAGVVIARAVAADLSTGAETVRALSLMGMVSSLGVLTAPLVGGAMLQITTWRGVLATLAAIAVVMFVLALVALPESLPADRRTRGGIRAVATGFGTLVRDRIFMGNAVSQMFGFAMMMAYISASSFVVQSVLGLGPLPYGLAFAGGAVAMIVATTINARVASTVGPRRMRALGISLGLAAGAALLIQSLGGFLTIVGFIACAVLITGGNGFINANSTALALERAPGARGTGSALLGFGQFLCGAIASPIVGLWGEHTAVPMAACVMACALGSAGGALVAHRHEQLPSTDAGGWRHDE